MNYQERLDNLLKNFVDAGVPGCGLSVSYKGKIVYTGYHGLARLEDQLKADENTVYKVASCSKLITSTAVMKLYEEGKLLLNDPIELYLPFFRNMEYQTYDGSNEITRHPTTQPITIKHLLTMTSGMPYMGKGSPTAVDYMEKMGAIFSKKMFAMTNMELAEEISKVPLAFDPGSHWHYGLSYDVLGAVVEAITGKTFGAYLKEAIFDPIGMDHTTFLCTEDMEKHLAGCYMYADGKHTNISTPPEMTPTNGAKLESGGGGLFSTLSDLTKFAGMWAQGGIWEGKRILSRNTIDLMRKNHLKGQPMEDFKKMCDQSYPWYKGYGWGLAGRTLVDCQEAGSNGSVGEFGWCGAYGPYILADPERELGIAYTQQMLPVIGGMQDYCHPRIRNVVYSLLEEWD